MCGNKSSRKIIKNLTCISSPAYHGLGEQIQIFRRYGTGHYHKDWFNSSDNKGQIVIRIDLIVQKIWDYLLSSGLLQ